MFGKFILVKVRGRLGNQLFQIAFAKAMGKQLNCFVFFDTDQQFVWNQYFSAPWSFKTVNQVMTILLKKIFIRKKYFSPISVSNDCLAKLSEISIPNVVFQGYFQSSYYFSSLSLADEMFTVRPSIMNHFYTKYNSLLKEQGIAYVHIRRSDYVNIRKHQLGDSEITLPADYYNACLMKLDPGKRKRIIVLSDDILWVKQHIKWATEFVHSTELMFDFLLMMHAETLIISNSTFAWWAAYLNKNAKTIFAPMYFLGYNSLKEYPAGIMSGTQFQWIHHVQ
jgi:hypothetical protein